MGIPAGLSLLDRFIDISSGGTPISFSVNSSTPKLEIGLAR